MTNDVIDVEVADEVAAEDDITKHPGVLVVRVPKEDGNQEIHVVEVNGHDPLASPTLLEAAVKVKRQQLNI